MALRPCDMRHARLRPLLRNWPPAEHERQRLDIPASLIGSNHYGNIMTRNHALLTLILVYGTASLAHFVHNAVYLSLYPNMPTWLTPPGVLAAWLGVAAIGAVGYCLFRKGLTVTGLAVIALYAALGFAGLDHYAIAPISAHSLMMNATIIAEVIAASALLVVIAWTALRENSTRMVSP
jgi:hypothetical protein